MGEANRRGSKEERIAAAVKKRLELHQAMRRNGLPRYSKSRFNLVQALFMASMAEQVVPVKRRAEQIFKSEVE